MKESVEYAKDEGGRIWRVDYTKGSAEHFPTSFNEILDPKSTETTECDRIDKYLRERGVQDQEFRQDKWYFRPVDHRRNARSYILTVRQDTE